MRLLRFSFLVLLSPAAGCATVAMMRELPPDVGQLARYDASVDTLAAAAEAAVRQQGLAVAEVTRPDDSTGVLIAQKRPGIFSYSYGEYVRIRIARDTAEPELTAVRVVTKPRNLLEIGHRERAPRVFRALDARLSAQAIGPWPGMRVRATPQGAPPITGNVVRVTRDTIVLQLGPSSAPRPLAIGDIGRLAVSRGSNNHTLEGMLIGVLIGGVVGTVVSSSSDSGDWVPDLGRVVGTLAGVAAGGVLGAAIGAGTRTEVWSEVPRRPRP